MAQYDDTLIFGTAIDNSGLQSGLNAAQAIASAAGTALNNSISVSVGVDTDSLSESLNSVQSAASAAMSSINDSMSINPNINSGDMQNDLDDLQSETGHTGSNMEDDLDIEPEIDSDGFKNSLSKLETFAINTAANIAAQIITSVSSALAEIPAQIVSVGSEFESSMSQVAATMGITSASAEFEQLSEAAKEMGETTKFSASQAADALNYLALAGYDAEKSCAALPTVLNLAAAGGIDLAEASDMVTDSMSALGLSMDELEGFADKMAKTSQKSNTSVAQLGQSILSVGANAQILAGGTTELMTELGILADSGQKSAEAGTALARVIKNLSTPTSAAAAELENLGVQCYDEQGNFRNMQDIFSDLQAAMDGFTAEQVQSSLSEIFDTAALSSAKILLSQCGERFDELSGYIDDAAGAASDMGDTMSDNLAGDITICQSALESLANAAYEKFQGTMRTAVQSVTEDIGTLSTSLKDGELSESMDKIAESFSRAASSAAELLADDVIPAIITGFSAIAEHGNEIISTVTGIGSAIAAMKAITAIDDMSAAFNKAVLSVGALSTAEEVAAFQTAAVKGELSLAQIAAGLYTGQVTLATVKQAAWNAVCSVNPYVALTAVLVGVSAAIATYSINAMKATETTQDAEKAVENAASALDDLSDSIDDNNSETLKNEDELKNKIAIYEDLRKQYEKTGEGEEQLKEIMEDIQSISPTTIQFIDDETGAYLSLADSIDEVISAMERKRKLDNAENTWNTAKDNLDGLYEQQQTLLTERDELNAELENAGPVKKGWIHNKIKENREALQEVSDAILENEKLVADSEKEIESYYSTSSSSSSSSDIDYSTVGGTIADEERRKGEEANKRAEEAQKKLAEEREAAAEALSEGWTKAEHDYAVGAIATEQDLYDQKLALWEQYGDESNSDHWKYQEDLIKSEQSLADERLSIEQQAAEERKKLSEEEYNAPLEALSEGWTELEHKYATGAIATEEEVLAEKKKLWAQYGDESRSDMWSYSEDILSIEESLAEESEQTAKDEWDHIGKLENLGKLNSQQAYEERKKWIEKYCPEYSDEWYEYYKEVYDYEQDFAQKQLDDRKELLKEELSAVKSNVSAILSEYKSSYSDIQSNISSYKSKLLDVAGSVFEVTETENEDGSTTKTYKVNDIKEQIETMKKYHAALLKMRDSGAPQSLLSEMMSLDPEDGLNMANYMFDSGDFESIKDLYSERDAIAQELAEDFYSDDISELNQNTIDKITAEYDTLPTEFQAIGEQAIKSLGIGMDIASDDLYDHLDSNLTRLADRADTVTENMTVSSVNVTAETSSGTDMKSVGKTDGEDYKAGFEEGADGIQTQITADVNANQTAAAAESSASASGITNVVGGVISAIKQIKIFNKSISQLLLDGKTLAESVNEYNNTLGRVTDS